MNLTQHKSTSPRPAVPRRSYTSVAAAMLALALLSLAACKKADNNKAAEEAPPAPTVVETGGSGSVHVAKPALFPLVQAVSRDVTSTLNVTGQVQPDVSREIPVLSLANGRVTALHVGLGDYVKKGQLVMEVQSPDVTNAFDAYLKAVNDEHLTRVTLDRDKLLYGKGAIPQTQLEAAQDGEDDARADLNAAEQQLHILGVDKNNPSENVKIYAPATGVIIAQNVTAAGAAGINYAGNSGSLLIADLSHIWVICDVYENDLATVHLGEHADIRLNAFQTKVYSGTISDIGAQLDSTLRTAKVRIQINNPDNLMRLGMFATATFQAKKPNAETAVPAAAILQLHDRSFVFVPTAESGSFRRVTIVTGRTLDGGLIEVLSGLSPGQQVVSNALNLQNSADQ